MGVNSDAPFFARIGMARIAHLIVGPLLRDGGRYRLEWLIRYSQPYSSEAG